MLSVRTSQPARVEVSGLKRMKLLNFATSFATNIGCMD